MGRRELTPERLELSRCNTALLEQLIQLQLARELHHLDRMQDTWVSTTDTAVTG